LRDPLREALEEVQWEAGWNQLQRLADPRQLAEAFEGYLSTLAVLPQQVEQAIGLLARPGAPAATAALRPGRRRPRARSQGALALGLAMAGLALTVQRLTQLPGLPGETIEKTGALLFLALGALFLWSAGGRR